MKFAKGTDKTGFCSITLLSGPAAGAQFCHIIAHSTTNDDLKMSKLEYALGMKYMELNLNSHYNILLLEPSFHWTFDQAHWALFPLDIAFINRMNKARFTVDSPLEKLYQGYEEHAWSYLFLPFPPMRDRYIVQCNPEGVESGPSKANPVVPPHYYPQHLPVIKSHIRPHFVIYDLVKKMLHNKRDELELRVLMAEWEEYNPFTMSICLRLYDKWTKVELPSDFKGPLPINDSTTADVAAGVVGSETGRSERRPGLRPKSLLQSITSLKKTDSGKTMRTQCVVSLASADLEVCHIFRPWVFDEGTMAKLEYEWGCEYGTFNYDVDTNRVYLTPELRRLFESNFWAFLPMDVTILNVLGRTSFPSKNKSIETAYNGAETFEYRLVPLPGMSRNPIFRADDSALSRSESHHFPYTTMPVLRLPIQPHFALMDFAHKFTMHEEEDIRSSLEFQPYFDEVYQEHTYCLCIHRLWMKLKVPPEFLRALGDTDACRASGETINSYRRQGAFSFLRDDPASIWDEDDVWLRPLDSVTNVSSHGDDDGSSDEEESDDEEETRSVFDTRMKRWIGEVAPAQSDEDVSFAHEEEVITNPAVPDLMPSDDDSDESDGGSPSIIATVKHVVEPFPAPNDPMILSKVRTRRISTVSDMSVDSSSFARA
ncbi:hypothetical protein H0H93_007304 [Arthromyces matolae]|nr:hypothetical protein H0H93_007304 [Arthromyces matolae]